MPRSDASPAIEIRPLILRLRWIMLAVILADIVITFVSQPASYWADPATVREGNRWFHAVMARGFTTALLVDVVYLAGSWLLVSRLPWRIGLTLLFALLLGHYFGASTWICFHYKLGVQGMVLYGVLVSVLVVLVGFRAKAA